MAWIERVLRALDRFQQGHTVLGFPVAVAKKYGDDQAGKHAALLAYYGFLSLFPLLLVFVTLLGYALANNQELQQHIIDTLIAQFPVLGSQIQDSITTIQGSGIGLVVGILGTLWGGLGITQSAQDAMNAVWNIPAGSDPTTGCVWPAASAPCSCWPPPSSRPPPWPSSAGSSPGSWVGSPSPAPWCSTCSCCSPCSKP